MLSTWPVCFASTVCVWGGGGAVCVEGGGLCVGGGCVWAGPLCCSAQIVRRLCCDAPSGLGSEGQSDQVEQQATGLEGGGEAGCLGRREAQDTGRQLRKAHPLWKTGCFSVLAAPPIRHGLQTPLSLL